MHDPLARFHDWLAAATAAEPRVPEACALATADARGVPSVRMVLLKDASERGFSFYTNLGSPKSRDLRDNPHAALCFHWKSLGRQVRVDGAVEPLPDGDADAYFATRPRESRIASWASRQSEALPSREHLEAEYRRYADRFGEGPVPRPPGWGGWLLVPSRMEFWEDRPFRLHDRVESVRTADGWTSRLLYP